MWEMSGTERCKGSITRMKENNKKKSKKGNNREMMKRRRTKITQTKLMA